MKIARLAEWDEVSFDWSSAARAAIAHAAQEWQQAHHLPSPPLEWGGIDGTTLKSRQWVGVIEVEGHRVEIYPKLDKALLKKREKNENVDEDLAASTMRALLPMLEAAGFSEWVETGQAELGVAPLSFPDVWAFLLGKHLNRELKRGLSNAYVGHQDDLPTVRGKVVVARQIAANFNRFDRIACAWDEFTSNTPLNRLLRCACLALRKRTTHPVARGLLGDCAFALDEVEDVTPATALRETERQTWSRATQRFEPCFRLARRILLELAPEMSSQSERSWTFLVDMNAVFEDFCRAAIEAKFGVTVEEQEPIGTLFHTPKRIRQIADFVWTQGGRWIGDAKWKLLGQNTPDFGDEIRAGALSPDDVRQLTVYAELLKLQEKLTYTPQLAILFPMLGQDVAPQTFSTWNGTQLHLWPVQVRGWQQLSEVLPDEVIAFGLVPTETTAFAAV